MKINLLTYIFLPLLTILIDLGIMAVIRQWWHRPKYVKTYFWSSVVMWAWLLVIFVWPKDEVEEGILVPMWMYYAFATIYFPKAAFLFFAALGMLPKLFKRKPISLGLWVGLPLATILFGVMWWGALWGRGRMEVVNVTIESPKLPEAFDGYRIVQFSDIHVGTWGRDTTFVSRLVDTINAQKADLILFTGDIVNRTTTELKPFLPVLSRLHAPDGVYSILGNHDYGDYIDWPNEQLHLANVRLLDKWERDMGWTLLNNDHDFLIRKQEGAEKADTLVLIGVENWGEPPFKQYGDLRKAYPVHPDSTFNTHDDRFKILMTHNPEHWRLVVASQTNIDLTLAGHTHAMQFQVREGNFRWSPASWFYKLWGGLYEKVNKDGDDVKLYVNIGAGEVGMPFRIGAAPEVTVITLKR